MGSCVSSDSTSGVRQAPGTLYSSPSLNRRDSNRWKLKKNVTKGQSVNCNRSSADGVDCRVSSNEDEILSIPGRMFSSGCSDAACLFTQKGKKGMNQDSMVVWEHFGSRDGTIFCGVFDGHGPFGHMVSKKVRDSLPVMIHAHWITGLTEMNNPHSNGSMNSEEDKCTESCNITENHQNSGMYPALRHSILRSFELMDKELELHPAINCFSSGCTAVTLIRQGQDLVIANIGDSRAILCQRESDDSLVAIQLTVDLKPNHPSELARIQSCKGRVFSLHDEPQIARVWLPNSNIPGLAMARAFGDFCLKDFGLISVPDIFYHRLSEKDEFVVLATDGVWDVLSNQEVVNIVSAQPNRETAARAIVDCAVSTWRIKFPSSNTDDCSVICLFLDHKPILSKAHSIPLGEETDMIELSLSSPLELHQENTSLRSYKNAILEIVEKLESKSEGMEKPKRCQSTRSLAECILSSEEERSATGGVTRIHSLLSLPRFASSRKKSIQPRKSL